MPEIPQELYYIIGTLVVSKFDIIKEFFQSRVKAEVRINTMEVSLQNLTLELGKLTNQLEKYQKDLNEFFRKSKNQ